MYYIYIYMYIYIYIYIYVYKLGGKAPLFLCFTKDQGLGIYHPSYWQLVLE